MAAWYKMCIRDSGPIRQQRQRRILQGVSPRRPIRLRYREGRYGQLQRAVDPQRQAARGEDSDRGSQLQQQPVSYTHLDVYKRQAQMLAAALNYYFTEVDPRRSAPSGSLGDMVFDIRPWSGAFGGATSMTLLQMLQYASGQSNAGGSVWYGQVKATQTLAKDCLLYTSRCV